MHTLNKRYGSFSVTFNVAGETGLVTIYPEMVKTKLGMSPTSRYHVHSINPVYGSSSFVVEQDENGTWICNEHPRYVSVCFVSWIGDQIVFRWLND